MVMIRKSKLWVLNKIKNQLKIVWFNSKNNNKDYQSMLVILNKLQKNDWF